MWLTNSTHTEYFTKPNKKLANSVEMSWATVVFIEPLVTNSRTTKYLQTKSVNYTHIHRHTHTENTA